MAETKPEPKAGDPCPNCGADFVEHRAPTDAERKAAEDAEQARPYPARVDNATAEQRAELGALYECTGCGYRTRIKADDDDDAPAAGTRAKGRAKAGAGSSKE